MTNHWFFDTEFSEDGTRIVLISIGLVSESGREYYAGTPGPRRWKIAKLWLTQE